MILRLAEADAPRVECALKMEQSTPTCSIVDFNHLVMVLDITALWGLMNDTDNHVSSPHSDLVLSRYILRVFTGHKEVFGRNDGKKNSSIGFPWRDCFAKVVGKNATPLLLGLILFMFSCDRSADLDGRVIANRRTVFRVSILSGRFSDCPHDTK